MGFPFGTQHHIHGTEEDKDMLRGLANKKEVVSPHDSA